MGMLIKHGQSGRQKDMREHKSGRDLMNPPSPTFLFSHSGHRGSQRWSDLFRVKELISDRAWALIHFSFFFSPFPCNSWGLGHHCPILASLPSLPSYHSVIQQYIFSICNGLDALQALGDTEAIGEGIVSVLWELTLMEKTTEQAIAGQSVICAMPARYMVHVGGPPHLLWGIGWSRRTSRKVDD